MGDGDTAFVGSIPNTYERLLVPLVFAEPARHIAAAVMAASPNDILETAAGTGVLTRALVAGSPADIVATDLNEAMIGTAATICASARLRWQVADALDLPFPDQSFDVVVCQFGVMFFPDKVQGYAEALRVLRPGGTFFFSAWDRIEANPAWWIVSDALNARSGDVPLEFLRRAPYSYFDPDLIRQHLTTAGFGDVAVATLAGTSKSTADETATAICQGTPLRNAIEAHPTMSLEQATLIATSALRAEYGDGPFTSPTSWLQASARVS